MNPILTLQKNARAFQSRVGRQRLAVGTIALTSTFTLAALSSACQTHDAEAQSPSLCPPAATAQAAQVRGTENIGIALADDGPQAVFQQGKALAIAAACSREPGDTFIAVRQHDFTTVFSAVVPGDPKALAGLARCGDVPIGGPSPECLALAEAQDELARWREAAARAIDAVTPVGTTAVSDCHKASGWPRDRIVQLLLALQPGAESGSASYLVIMGDADDPAGQQPLSEYVSNVHILVAPFVLSCGQPDNLRQWFRNAASVDLYPAESPAGRFPAFLDSLAHFDRGLQG